MAMKFSELPPSVKPHIYQLYQIIILAPFFISMMILLAFLIAKASSIIIPIHFLIGSSLLVGLISFKMIHSRHFESIYWVTFAPTWATKWLSFWIGVFGFVFLFTVVLLAYLPFGGDFSHLS